MRMVPNFDQRIFRMSVQIETKMRPKLRCISKSLREEALQHIDIALAYIDLGIINSGETILALLYNCFSKQEVLSVLVPLIARYQTSDDPQLTTFLKEFSQDVQAINAHSEQ